ELVLREVPGGLRDQALAVVKLSIQEKRVRPLKCAGGICCHRYAFLPAVLYSLSAARLAPVRKRFAARYKLVKQRRGLEAYAVAGAHPLDIRKHAREPRPLRVEHRAAAPYRIAVTVDE